MAQENKRCPHIYGKDDIPAEQLAEVGQIFAETGASEHGYAADTAAYHAASPTDAGLAGKAAAHASLMAAESGFAPETVSDWIEKSREVLPADRLVGQALGARNRAIRYRRQAVIGILFGRRLDPKTRDTVEDKAVTLFEEDPQLNAPFKQAMLEAVRPRGSVVDAAKLTVIGLGQAVQNLPDKPLSGAKYVARESAITALTTGLVASRVPGRLIPPLRWASKRTVRAVLG